MEPDKAVLGDGGRTATAEERLQEGEARNAAFNKALPALDTDLGTRPSESSPLLGRRRRDSVVANGARTYSPPAWNGMEHFEGLPWYRRPHVLWLAIPFLVLAITFGATIVPLVDIVRSLLCRDMYGHWSDPEVCNNNDVSAAVAMFQLYAQVITGSLSAITSPFLGAWSDRYGRLRMLAITSLGMLAKDAFVLGLFFAKGNLSVWWLLVAYALDGICGSFTAGMAISHAYASDCIEPDKRAAAFGWFHGALFTGIALGPLMASWIVQSAGQLIVIFYVAIAAHTIYFMTLFVIPESLSKKRQADARQKHAEEKVRREKAAKFSFESRHPEIMTADRNGLSARARVTLAAALHRIREHNFSLAILWPTGPGTSSDLRKNLVILAAVVRAVLQIANPHLQ